MSFSTKYELSIEVEINDRVEKIEYTYDNINKIFIVDDRHGKTYQGASTLKERYPFYAVFFDVDINYAGKAVQTVGSTELDKEVRNQKSTSGLPTQINQLIVDVQASDDADTAESVRSIDVTTRRFDDIKRGRRMERFTSAFNKMFDGLS